MKKLLTFSFIFFFTVVANGQNPYVPYASEQITISSAALGFTASKIRQTSTNTAIEVHMTVNCASGTSCILRFNVDGVVTPTASLGERALYGDSVTIKGLRAIENFRGIREISTDVILDVTYFRK